MRKTKIALLLLCILVICFSAFGCSNQAETDTTISAAVSSEQAIFSAEESVSASFGSPSQTSSPSASSTPSASPSTSLSDIPEYSDSPYIVLNDNIPNFTENELAVIDSFEEYTALDSLGRCGTAYACIGIDLMPTEERGDISDVYPSGWMQAQYDGVDGGYLYNRCHLIGHQLSGEDANERNLITGTRYMNTEGMLPFENMVADYVKETNNHVLYRVTPVFEGNNLVASGVQIEAYSLEDNGEGVCFNIYAFNVQPGITINYLTGASNETKAPSQSQDTFSESSTYILNTNTHKFHYPDCSSVDRMSERNKEEFTGSRDEVISMGYEPCGNCNP